MRVLTARYAEGRLDLPAGSIEEGEVVTLLVPEDQAGFRLTSDERSRLAASIAQAERGEVVDGWDLLDDLSA